MGSSAFALGIYTVNDLLNGGSSSLRVGFRNSAPINLWKWSKKALWYEKAKDGLIHCLLCPHECMLYENDRGQCRVRVVKNNELFSLVYGNPCALHIDPIEKKPLYHFLPGTPIFSLATAGCNLRCVNCQNWEISQRKPEDTENVELFPDELVRRTFYEKIPSIAYTYSEPIIFYEYVLESAKKAREKNIRNVLVTAGFINEAPLKELCQFVDAANVDIKAFNEAFYKKFCRARLSPILNAITKMREYGVWIEITRLIVPKISDDLEDFRKMCKWIYENMGKDTPLHISRFYSAYKLLYLPPTSKELLFRAYEIAKEENLDYVYVGNVVKSGHENTVCPNCKKTVIEREGYKIIYNKLINGKCPCGYEISGIWNL